MGLKSNLWICVKAVCRTACVVLALYMAILQVLRYLENKDSSSVHYRRFNFSPIDRYPTLTICIHTRRGEIYDAQYINKTLGIKTQAYADILSGNHNAGLDIKNVSGIDMHNATIKFHDVFRMFDVLLLFLIY